MEKIIHNVETGNITTAEMTDAEVFNLEAIQVKEATQEAEAISKAQARAAILERLGLTIEEAEILLS